MKTAVFVVFELGAKLDGLIKSLSDKGYNGAIIPSSSFSSSLLTGNEDEPMTMNLTDLSSKVSHGNPTFMTLVEEKNLPEVKSIINEYTDHFRRIKGGMFGVPLDFFEGSF
jgi:hypothetical protein